MPVKNCRSGAISLSVVTQARLCADENPYIAPCCPSFYPQPCFWYRCAFHPYQKHGSSARARNGLSPTSATVRHIDLRHPGLRGRRPVRADHRLGTDEKHIRAQSAIADKTPALSLLLFKTVFSARKTRLARASAQVSWRMPPATGRRRSWNAPAPARPSSLSPRNI